MKEAVEEAMKEAVEGVGVKAVMKAVVKTKQSKLTGSESSSKKPKGSEENIMKDWQLLSSMSLIDLRSLTQHLLERQPGLIFDVLEAQATAVQPTAPSSVQPVLSWCKCINCEKMPTTRERKCCTQEPPFCVSTLPHFSHYCLDPRYLTGSIRRTSQLWVKPVSLEEQETVV
ncbi:hypothetical protein WMY93_032868 [Mugilogobius chulae]|uniref:P2X purinoreceptor 7 intracellular domain-containing protein n=1 Tax=Mugilogobius chulae TaxID=88201 RepID=A0AAW0MV24_9GOBI